MTEVKTLLSGLVVGESPRWHAGRLWFSNWGAQEIIAVDPKGNSEVMLRVPTTIPFSIDWLPDGRLLVVSGQEAKLLVQQPDGSLQTYAELGHLAKSFNEIVVDGRGNTYVNGSDFEFPTGPFIPGIIALVTADGAVRQVADDIHFPNGMVVTPDNSTLIVAESFRGRLTAFDIAADGSLSNRRAFADFGRPGVGDGICMDADGAIWTSALAHDGIPYVMRVAEGGHVLHRVDVPLGCFACMLGGPDARTLFMLCADFQGTDKFEQLFSSRSGVVLTTEAPAPRAGYP
jgi:sugar lactone lactonase YvrE